MNKRLSESHEIIEELWFMRISLLVHSNLECKLRTAKKIESSFWKIEDKSFKWFVKEERGDMVHHKNGVGE